MTRPLMHLAALALLICGTDAAPSISAAPDLVAAIRNAGLQSLQTKSASIEIGKSSRCLELTFEYVHGDAEIRVPAIQSVWPADWKTNQALSVELRSTSVEPLYMDFIDGAKKNTILIEPLAGTRVRVSIPFDRGAADFHKYSRTGANLWPEKLAVPAQVDTIVFRMHYPAARTEVDLCGFALSAEPQNTEILDRVPVIDRFGQWSPEKWDGKVSSDRELQALWAKEVLPQGKSNLCPLGGDTATQLKSTGFFRTEKNHGRWVLVDPHGHPFFSLGMDLVGNRISSFATPVTGVEFLFADLPPAGAAWMEGGKLVSFYVANLMKRYGEGWEEKAGAHLLDRLRNWGFNTIGNWPDEKLAASSRMPYVLPLYGWYSRKMFYYPYSLPDVFSEEFQQRAEATAKEQCEAHKDDPNLLGWFLDNEPVWGAAFDLNEPWADIVLKDPEPSATQDHLKALLAASPQDAADIKSRFAFECIRKYLEVVTAAVRKADPHHLILGVRYAGPPDEQWLKLSSLFDVFSVNIYNKGFAPDPQLVHHWSQESGRPVLIGEFTSAAPGRGMQGLFYGRFKAKDQIQRGVAYQYFVENAAANPDIVGAHWFQLVDDMPTGRQDGERLNYGFLNVLDVPYEPLVRAARESNQRLYQLVFGLTKPSQTLPRMN